MNIVWVKNYHKVCVICIKHKLLLVSYISNFYPEDIIFLIKVNINTATFHKISLHFGSLDLRYSITSSKFSITIHECSCANFLSCYIIFFLCLI